MHKGDRRERGKVSYCAYLGVGRKSRCNSPISDGDVMCDRHYNTERGQKLLSYLGSRDITEEVISESSLEEHSEVHRVERHPRHEHKAEVHIDRRELEDLHVKEKKVDYRRDHVSTKSFTYLIKGSSKDVADFLRYNFKEYLPRGVTDYKYSMGGDADVVVTIAYGGVAPRMPRRIKNSYITMVMA